MRLVSIRARGGVSGEIEIKGTKKRAMGGLPALDGPTRERRLEVQVLPAKTWQAMAQQIHCSGILEGFSTRTQLCKPVGWLQRYQKRALVPNAEQ